MSGCGLLLVRTRRFGTSLRWRVAKAAVTALTKRVIRAIIVWTRVIVARFMWNVNDGSAAKEATAATIINMGWWGRYVINSMVNVNVWDRHKRLPWGSSIREAVNERDLRVRGA